MKALSTRVKKILKWDVVILILCTNVDGVGIFTSLQLRTIQWDNAASITSFIFCILTNIIVAYLLIKALYVLIGIRKETKTKKVLSLSSLMTKATLTPGLHKDAEEEEIPEKYNDYGILFRSFKSQTFLHQGFMFFWLLRVYLCDIVIGYFFEYPLQCLKLQAQSEYSTACLPLMFLANHFHLNHIHFLAAGAP
ncbi:MAG: hypothetical protein EOO43_23470 [Flavobacterium sp.]|nr:MAG: hypothetical protein EOO43_23470 [Flavobacterium sp.]